MDVVKTVGKYLNTPVGTICYNTDKVLTTLLDKENVEGLASIILRLAAKSGTTMSQEQTLLSYQWLEHIAMYANQAITNSNFAKSFLQVLTTLLDKENVEGLASIILRLAAKSGTTMSQEQTLLSYQWLEHIAMYANQAITNSNFAKSFLQGINKALEKSTYLTGNYFTVTDIAAYHVLYPLIERISVSEQESLLHIKKNVEGLASIILRLAAKSGTTMSQEQTLLSYQWLEHIAMYANQAITNSNFAKSFLQVLTTLLDKENVEGLASIILRLAAKSGTTMSQEQTLLSYQWLEHIAMYANQAITNSNFAKSFLQGINKALEKSAADLRRLFEKVETMTMET
ncbi:unnamed protein product, partial [Brenthis ino]